jgi:hypothetical protein
VEGGGRGLTVSGVSRNRGGFVKCVTIQKRLGIPGLVIFCAIELGHSPTKATRLRFDQESRLHLIHGESSLRRGRAGGRSAITN